MKTEFDNTTTGGSATMGAAARRVLLVVAICLVAGLVGFAFGAWVLPALRGGEAPISATLETDPELLADLSEWNLEAAPEYYRVVGSARISWSLAEGEVEYGELDVLGRATYARACVTPELMEAGLARERGSLQSFEPSGWGYNAKVSIPLADGGAYNGYLWNRSHLLAKSLGGADDLRNLVCGTRMQNVGSNFEGGGAGGMGYGELLCRTWLEEHQDGWILYSATPVYVGEELVCRSVMVDVLSSDGAIDMRIEVYNAAEGVEIDYATGGFELL